MSKVIPGDRGAAYQRWELSGIQANSRNDTVGLVNKTSAQQFEQTQKQAYQQGLERGHKEGLILAHEEMQRKCQYLEMILATLATPLNRLDDEVEKELVALAMAVAQHIIRREFRIDPSAVVSVVQEAMSALPISSRKIRLYLNPEDVALIQETLAVKESEQGWQILEDPSQARGGCRLETDTSRLDASVEKRLAAIAVDLLGGDRDRDRDRDREEYLDNKNNSSNKNKEKE